MAPYPTPLRELMPPLVVGTGTFSPAYNDNPEDASNLPALDIVKRALDLGVSAFDTSPYYGPSESILGAALSHPSVTSAHPRSSYFLATKAGRILTEHFDYTPEWFRYSVYRSLERLHTDYLDLVYAHDVEFVSPAEALAAVKELRRLRDEEGKVRHVGVSAFPVDKLCEIAELVLRETGEPLDAVLSYGNYTIQNQTLVSSKDGYLKRLRDAGVDVVLNASLLGLGLMTTRGVDAAPTASWHCAPPVLRKACHELVPVAKGAGELLESVALRWSMDNWARVGAEFGSAAPNPVLSLDGGKRRMGISLSGISKVSELEQTFELFQSVRKGLLDEEEQGGKDTRTKMQGIVDKMRGQLGELTDSSWPSPPTGYVNGRKKEDMGAVPTDDGIMEKYLPKA